MSIQVTKLPLFGIEDGDVVLDEVGNQYRFDAEERTWIYEGVIQSPPIVTEEQAGLVTPEIFEKLTLINKLIKNGIKFNTFKIDSDNLLPYFYFFYSSDDLIRFYPESQNKLRLEIDRARLTAKLAKKCCVGPKGKVGIQGRSGHDGKVAANEIFHAPISTKENIFKFETFVSTPIDTAMSLRIFDENNEQLIEFLIPMDSGDIEIVEVDNSPEVEISSLSLEFDVSSNKLSGAIKFTSNIENIDKWRYKARQRGSKGDVGVDGLDFFEIIDQNFDDPLLRASEAIVSLRKPETSDNVLFIKRRLFDEVCSFNLLPSNILPRGKIEQSSFVAVRVISKQCKDICKYKFIPNEFVVPPLDLPSWTPTPDCCDAGHYNISKFNWFDKVNPRYMFRIMTASRPPEECCQEPFFWCPNVGDVPCGIDGRIDPPPTFTPQLTGSPSLDLCKCDSPIAFELQNGGFTLPPMDCINGPKQIDPISSVIGGSIDQYNQKVVVAGKWTIKAKIEFDDKLCADQKNKPGYIDDCPVNVTGGVTGGQTQSGTIPAVLTFTGNTGFFNGVCPPQSVLLTVIVNTDQINCCRGYKISSSVECICPTVPPPTIQPPPTPPPEPTLASPPTPTLAPPVATPGPPPVSPPVTLTFKPFGGDSATQSSSTVPPPAGLTLVLPSVTDMCVGDVFSQTGWATATGGTPPYVFTEFSGSLPQFLHLDTDGDLFGFVQFVVDTSVTIRVTDDIGNTDDHVVSVTSVTDSGACPSSPNTLITITS